MKSQIQQQTVKHIYNMLRIWLMFKLVSWKADTVRSGKKHGNDKSEIIQQATEKHAG